MGGASADRRRGGGTGREVARQQSQAGIGRPGMAPTRAAAGPILPQHYYLHRGILGLQESAGNRAVQRLASEMHQIQRKGAAGRDAGTTLRPAGKSNDVSPLRKIRRAHDGLTGEHASLLAEQSNFDRNFYHHFDNLIKSLQDTVQAVNDWGSKVDRARLHKLRPKYSEHVVDTIVSEVAGLAKKTPAVVLAFILEEGLAAYRHYEANSDIDKAVSLSDVQRDLEGTLLEGMLELVKRHVVFEGSLLFLLRQYARSGAFLLGRIESEKSELEYVTDALAAGHFVSERRVRRRLDNADLLTKEHAEWFGEYLKADQDARDLVAAMPEEMRDALLEVMISYAELGGTNPKEYRLELTHFQFEKDLLGRRGVVARNRGFLVAVVAGRGYHILQQSSYGLGLHPGRPIEITGVELRPEYKDHPEQLDLVKILSSNIVGLHVELKPYWTRVPDVRGLRQDIAAGRLIDRDLGPDFVYVPSEIAKGHVLYSVPTPGNRLMSDSRVTLTVSDGPSTGGSP